MFGDCVLGVFIDILLSSILLRSISIYVYVCMLLQIDTSCIPRHRKRFTFANTT